MKKYDFNHIVDRSKTSEVRTDYHKLKELYGVDKLIVSTMADTDFGTPQEIIDAMNERAKTNSFSYSFSNDEFFKAIEYWYKTQHGVDNLKPENILLTHGTNLAINELIKSFTKPGDAVIVNTPVYGHFLDIIKNNDRIPVFNELEIKNNKFEINFQKFEEQIRDNDVKMFIFCNPHNPGGRIWTKKEIKTLLELCDKYNVFVISDEVHSDLPLNNHKVNTALKISRPTEQVVVLNSPNKPFNLAGIKASYAISKNEIVIEKMANQYLNDSDDLTNLFSPIAMIAAYTNPDILDYLNQLNQVVYDNYLYFKKELGNLKSLKMMDVESSYLIWAKQNKYDDEKFRELTIKNGVVFSPYTDFVNAEPGWFRINIATNHDTIVKMVDALKKVLN